MISTSMFLSLYTFVRTNQMFVLINIKEFEPPKGKKKKGKKGRKCNDCTKRNKIKARRHPKKKRITESKLPVGLITWKFSKSNLPIHIGSKSCLAFTMTKKKKHKHMIISRGNTLNSGGTHLSNNLKRFFWLR